ncbi:hypothetical protein P9040_23945 [Bacillus thuringiensis]|nr:hypothetical protein [Bacillus thuringiensis]MEC2746670.1 hypothetical protein [Bacillus thuringiensis]MEC3227492.1 hypothetical protein [Bacillus thuringiensis]MEC3365737.1 hypothetical protein [Bacillus thuringiensis]MEC3443940.1 hypothetical protein [Bacillus thuringiensis]MED2104954.1 hypothetical protein [Bacillus thuringiensis]
MIEVSIVMLDIEIGGFIKVTTNECKRIGLFFGGFELTDVRKVIPKYIN